MNFEKDDEYYCDILHILVSYHTNNSNNYLLPMSRSKIGSSVCHEVYYPEHLFSMICLAYLYHLNPQRTGLKRVNPCGWGAYPK
jgi:hypothetical protein